MLFLYLLNEALFIWLAGLRNCDTCCVIFLIDLTKFKIEGRADVEKLTSVPVVGDIPLTDEKNSKDGSIAVFENQNNLMSETFRNIRTNIQFMLQNDKKVILVTSTVSGEGKSFTSANLAISFSLLGKKVVIVVLIFANRD